MKNNKQYLKRFKNAIFIFLSLIFLVLLTIFLLKEKDNSVIEFNKINAYQHVLDQLEFGPRYPNSDGHKLVMDYIVNIMNFRGWEVNVQISEVNGHEISNIVSKIGSGNETIIIGAHYDTRMFASNEIDSDLMNAPIPGANDGASGVAVMLELARVIPKDINKEIYFVFFDQEDNGGIDGAEWAMGSKYFVDKLNFEPDSVIIIDMIGDINLNIYREKNSNKALLDEIWKISEELGFKEFIDQERYSLIDDHSPFINKGFNAILLIDFDYAHWHLTSDTADKISADSLKIVGDTILAWLIKD